MNFLHIALLPILVAAVTVFMIHPTLVKVALLKQIVDNPNARKLNKTPIPVLGGVGVFFGIMFSMAVAGYYFSDLDTPVNVILAMLLLLYTGVGDDILDLSPMLRFAMQIFAVCLIMFLGGVYIDNFHGIWGIYDLPKIVAGGLTVFSCVGIINALNLIDGVDGLCSGYGIFASLLFAFCFVRIGDVEYSLLAFSMFGALVPFVIHNVFGHKTKMFLGDGGSLVIGFLCALFVTRIIQTGSDVVTGSTVSFTLAVLSIPVFDTVRVMLARIAQRRSPFSPDKTHLHHMFISLGFSHVITTINILILNGLVVVAWHMCNVLNTTVETQLYVTAAAAFIVTWGLYYTVDIIRLKNAALYESMQALVGKYSIHRNAFVKKIGHALDKYNG
ncbi:MAG: undecaprenyl/decaprenyl-phosphate alpha-N-acetylglucosaminyl 1-phosphate transferase [Alistipes sp.]|nr:undecaprenyl/decaprenyl-phosphate alpha-N-acetylglucosaminyl 1-phosphate transferase [Alistipes sp.]